MSPTKIYLALAEYKSAGIPFDIAWEQAVGGVPPGPLRADDSESVARATYRMMRAAYLNELPRGRLHLSLATDAHESRQSAYGKGSRLVA
jgi:hypothetical protein